MSREANLDQAAASQVPTSERPPISEAALEESAWRALRRAHAPYSRFAVGAALETRTGEIAVGCNLENASLGLGICAERVALFSALARGWQPGGRLVIVTRTARPTAPCGACREVLRQFVPQLQISSISASGARKQWHLQDLLPPVAPNVGRIKTDHRTCIARKRDGRELTTAEIHGLIQGLVSGEVDPYQMSAFMMAVCWRGMSRREIRDLTEAMLGSGARLDLSGLPGARIDKHSTGGVGDKVSIPLVPLVLAAGLRVPMISGRGLGHTGGTLDKLDSIPGYATELPIARLHELVRDPGGFIAGQTRELVPADQIMYALRDVSATIESVPLIVSSILSKKLAAGLTGLVLDVKFGCGAFMPDRQAAEELARVLVDVSVDLGLPAVALLTRMDDPIGETVGNVLEMQEAMRLLTDTEVAADLRELTLGLGGLMVALAGGARTMGEGADLLERKRRGGEGAEFGKRWIAAQGGDPHVVVHPDALPVSSSTRVIRARTEGFVQSINARKAGRLCTELGGGRHRMEELIDERVGLHFHRRRGDRVSPGEALVTLFLPQGAKGEAPVDGEDDLYRIGQEPPPEAALIAALVTKQGTFEDPWNVPVGSPG
ncbi:MAG: thymidine phosphorylase [Candidatus Eisenbacteria sp.]|nr:thymidine phosphorylase [Candidatus Eisenbacteria bacterium]